jgi:excisionase family DNA binding protein
LGRGSQMSRLALTRREAADSLGMSVDSFERYVQPEIRLVRRGTLRLVPVAELEAWLRKNADSVPHDWE